MNIKKEAISATKVKLTIELTVEELSPYTDEAYKLFSKNVHIHGFRPGKAPKNLVKKEVGEDRFYQEVLERALPVTYYQALQQENLVSVSQPSVQVVKYGETSGLEYTAEFEVLPEVKLPDYTKVQISKKKISVSEKDIEETVKALQDRAAEFKEVERAAKKGDRVEIDFSGTRKGVPVEGTDSKNHPLVIGEGMFIPGFEENLIGVGKGEEKTFDVKFPDDYHAEALKGESVTFKVKMISISEKSLPVINDEFAKKFGGFETIDQLKEAASENIQKTKELEEKRRLEEEIMNSISEKTNIELPDNLVHQEIHKMLHDVEHNLSHSGLTLEQYLEMSKKSQADLEKEIEPEAAKRVKYGLILSEVAAAEKVETTEADLKKEKDEILAGAGPHLEEYKKRLEDPEFITQLKNSIVARKTLEKLFSYCVKE